LTSGKPEEKISGHKRSKKGKEGIQKKWKRTVAQWVQ
jgi:hypothetical protein